MATRYVVTAPLVVVKVADGSDRYVYEGGPVPEGVADETLKHLLDIGLIATPKAAEKAAVEEAKAEAKGETKP